MREVAEDSGVGEVEEGRGAWGSILRRGDAV